MGQKLREFKMKTRCVGIWCGLNNEKKDQT